MMQEKINMQVDTTSIEQELANYEKQLRQAYAVKSKLIQEIDSLDPDDRHYINRKENLDNRLYNMYDKIEGIENQLIEALVSEIQIYDERQPNGQWIKSIKFRLPIIEEDMDICLDNDERVETVALMSKKEQ